MLDRISVVGQNRGGSSEATYWHFLEVLPPQYMDERFFCFAEGMEPHASVLAERSHSYFTRQLDLVRRPIDLCDLAGLPRDYYLLLTCQPRARPERPGLPEGEGTSNDNHKTGPDMATAIAARTRRPDDLGRLVSETLLRSGATVPTGATATAGCFSASCSATEPNGSPTR